MADVDGDVCHHVHNAAKTFCQPFKGWVEMLLMDVHNDMKWSADIREYLGEICELLSKKFAMPQCHVPHRWLSTYDV